MFERKKNADAFLLTAKTEVRDGVHVADADTVTVAEAGMLWIKSGEAAGLRQHLDLHITPTIGAVKLNKLTAQPDHDHCG